MKCDVAVIGGGAIGLSCAWRLAQGGAKVALFKGKDIRSSASWAAAGMLAPLVEAVRHPPENAASRDVMLQLGLQSRGLYPAFVEDLDSYNQGAAASYLWNGQIQLNDPHHHFLYIATQESDQSVQRFREWNDESQIRITGTEIIDELTEAEKNIFEEELRTFAGNSRVIHLPQAGWVHNRLMWKALVNAAQQCGVQIFNDMVQGVKCNHTHVESIETSLRSLKCDKVLLCTGAHSGNDKRLRPGIEGLPSECVPPVRPVKGHMLSLTRPWGTFLKTFYTSDFYLVPRPSSLIIGATMEERGDLWRDARGVWKLLNSVQKVFPKLLDQKINAHWAGLRPATPDGLPILGRTPLENLFVATGHFRNGILLTPITAQLMADCILNGKEPPPQFSLARFHQ